MANPFDPDDQEDQDPEAVRGLIAAARASGDFDMDLSQDPEALGANAFSRLRSQMLDQGKTNAPVQHFVDPRNEMSPEQFLSAAQGRDDVDPNMTMSPEQFSEAAAIRGLKSLAPTPQPRDAAELRGIAPDEAKARLDQQLQLLPEREAPMRPQGTPPTPDVKATTPPDDDAMDERPASQASVVSPDTRARLPGSEGKGAMPALQLRAESKEPPAMRGYTPDAIRGLTGRSSRTDDEGPDVNPLAVLAAALDRNPGRALAEVMGVAGQQKQAWQANRQKQAQQDIENEQKGALTRAQVAKLQAESDPGRADRKLSLQEYEASLRARGLTAEEARDAVSRQRFAAENDPNSKEFQGRLEAQKQLAHDRNYEGATGRYDARGDAQPVLRDAIAGEATARVAATDAQRHADAPLANADAAARASQSAEARLPYQRELKGVMSPSEERARADEELARKPVPGITIVDKDAWNSANIDKTENSKNRKYITGGQVPLSALDRMIEIRKQVGANPRLLEDDATARKLRDEMSTLQKQAIGGATIMGNSGVLNGAEFPRYAADIPSGDIVATDFSDALLGNGRDTILEKLEGSRNAMRQAYSVGLKSLGARQTTRGDELQRMLQQTPAPKPKLAIDDPFSQWESR